MVRYKRQNFYTGHQGTRVRRGQLRLSWRWQVDCYVDNFGNCNNEDGNEDRNGDRYGDGNCDGDGDDYEDGDVDGEGEGDKEWGEKLP